MGGNQMYRDIYITAKDGLKLHVRDYSPALNTDAPHAASEVPAVVCLPGMARTAADFHSLAVLLASDPHQPHRVIAIDYRGRGLSEWDQDWTHYSPIVEIEDLRQTLTALGIARATFVGTSRGGLLVMGLVAAAPELIHAVVLNDIGPVVEAQGLVRIRGYLGKLPQPTTLDEAVDILRSFQSAQFPALETEHWQDMARGTWREDGDTLTLAYDPALRNTLENVDLEKAAPPIWPLFEALSHLPLMVVRGERSDILTADTLDEMKKRNPAMEVLEIPGQGHTPVMSHAEVSKPIASFIQRVSLAGSAAASTAVTP